MPYLAHVLITYYIYFAGFTFICVAGAIKLSDISGWGGRGGGGERGGGGVSGSRAHVRCQLFVFACHQKF